MVLSPSTMTAAELARAFNDQTPSKPAEEVAASAIASLSEWPVRLIAIELLTAQIDQVRRAEVRTIEKGATVAAVSRAVTRSEARRERVEALSATVIGIRLDLSRKFLASTFRVNGEHVTWGAATYGQHAAYVEREASKVIGIQDTIARHMEAMVLIERANVANLNALAKR